MRFRIEHRIGVAAPAAEVWAVIADLDRWGEWNPVYPKVSGRIAIGAPLEVRFEPPGGKPMDYRGVVGDWVPGEQLVWTARFAGGLVKATRYVEIEPLSETGCILANGEWYEGVGAGLMSKRLKRSVHQAFEIMNERAKARIEAARAGVERTAAA